MSSGQHPPALRDLTVPHLVHLTSAEAGQGPRPLPGGIAGVSTPMVPILNRTLNLARTPELRARRGVLGPRNRVVCQDEDETEVDEDVAINIRHVYTLSRNGPEPTRDLNLDLGNVVAGEYRIEGKLGGGSFASVFRALHIRQKTSIALKMQHNDKDCHDTGLGEIRMYTQLYHRGGSSQHIVRMLDCFYFKEHLFIVTELLGPSVKAHYMHLEAHGNRRQHYNAETIGSFSAQLLDALGVLARLGVAHCDVKTDNVCLADNTGKVFKLIDLGSAVYVRGDTLVSYIQSRWYRAPEVMLGCKWDTKIDIWALGCIIAELVVGRPLFMFSTVEQVLGAQKAVCGPFPSRMLTTHPIADMFFTDAGDAYELDPEGHPPGAYLLTGAPDSSLRALLGTSIIPADFGGDVNAFAAFLASLLVIDPERRPTAAAALELPWITPYRVVQPA